MIAVLLVRFWDSILVIFVPTFIRLSKNTGLHTVTKVKKNSQNLLNKSPKDGGQMPPNIAKIEWQKRTKKTAIIKY